MNKRFLMLVLICLTVLSSISFADRGRGAVLFLMIGPGARATGMGEAFVALADDPTATYWNPAGLGLHPLSSEWKDYKLPDDEEIVSVAALQPKKFSIGSGKVKLWAASENHLYSHRKNDWVTYETYVTAPEETVYEIIKSYLGGAGVEESEINSIAKKVIEYNKLDVTEKDYLVPDMEIYVPFEFFYNGKITALYGNGDELLVGTDNGLYRRSEKKWDKLRGKNTPGDRKIVCISGDENQNFGVGTNDGFFYNKYGRWMQFTTANGLPSNKISAIYVHDASEVYVGTDMGIAKMNKNKFMKTYEYTVPTDSVESWNELAEKYFGIYGNDRQRYFLNTVRVSNGIIEETAKLPKKLDVPYAPFFESPVTSIYKDKYGNLWFGSETGAKSFDGTYWESYGWKTLTIDGNTKYEDMVKAQWPELDDAKSEALMKKLMLFNRSNTTQLTPGKIVMIPSNPASGHIYSITASTSGDVFLSSEYGLLQYSYGKQAFNFYNQSDLSTSKVPQIVNLDNNYVFNASDKISSYSRGTRGLSLMHVRWLPELASDMYYEFLSGTYYLEGWGTIGGSFTYMYMGESEYRDQAGNLLGTFNSYDMALTLSYGTSIGSDFAMGLNFKLVHSSLARGVRVGGELKDGTATVFAVDAGLNYRTPIPGLSVGAAVQNIGPDVQYIDAAQADPLPRNLKFGLAFIPFENEFNRFTIAADINKELITDPLADPLWLEWHESVKNFGFEYTYSDFISFRGGYILDYDYYPKSGYNDVDEEDLTKDNYKSVSYWTIGAGITYGKYIFDFAYIPEQSDDDSRLPLSNIMRFSFSAEF